MLHFQKPSDNEVTHFNDWVRTAGKGDVYSYHYGHLSYDIEARLSPDVEKFKLIRAATQKASDAGTVLLIQRPGERVMSEGGKLTQFRNWTYLAVRTRAAA